MVKLIIDAIIDNYERKLDDMRGELRLTSTALASANTVRDEAVNKEVDLLKQVTQLKRELVSAQVDLDTTKANLRTAVTFIPVSAMSAANTENRDALLDVLFTMELDDHIDSLIQADAAVL